MLDGLTGNPRPYLITTSAVPGAVGVATGFSQGLGCLLFLVGLPLIALVLVVLVAAQVAASFRWVRAEKRAIRAIIAAVLIPVTMLALGPPIAWASFRGGQHVGTMTSLAIHMRTYLAIIAEEQRKPRNADYAERYGQTYNIDPGPPIRIAFGPEGLLDNWRGIVFDPSGRVMEADGWDASGKFRAPEDITKLFGGDLVSCRHLWGDFYDCLFT